MSNDLEKRVDRLESELGVESPVFDSPSAWLWDHLFVFENANDSGFSLGYDEDGDPIIRHDHSGYVACIDPQFFKELLDKAAEQKGEDDE